MDYDGRPTLLCSLSSGNEILIGEEFRTQLRVLETTTGTISDWKPVFGGTSATPLGVKCMVETRQGILIENYEGWKLLDSKPDAPTFPLLLPHPDMSSPIGIRFTSLHQIAVLGSHTLQIASGTSVCSPILRQTAVPNDSRMCDNFNPNPSELSFSKLFLEASVSEQISIVAHAYLLGAGPTFFEQLQRLLHPIWSLNTELDYDSLVSKIARPLLDPNAFRSSRRITERTPEDCELHLTLELALQWFQILCNFRLHRIHYMEHLNRWVDEVEANNRRNEGLELQRLMSSLIQSDEPCSSSSSSSSSTASSSSSSSSPSTIDPSATPVLQQQAAPAAAPLALPAASGTTSPPQQPISSVPTSTPSTLEGLASLLAQRDRIIPSFPNEYMIENIIHPALFSKVVMSEEDLFFITIREIGRKLEIRRLPIATTTATVPQPLIPTLSTSVLVTSHHCFVEIHPCIVCPQWPWFRERVDETCAERNPGSPGDLHLTIPLPEGFSPRLFFCLARAMHGEALETSLLSDADLSYVRKKLDSILAGMNQRLLNPLRTWASNSR